MTEKTPKPEADAFAGQGGSYEVGSDGKRKLVERTEVKPIRVPSPAPVESVPPLPVNLESAPSDTKRK